MNIYYLCRLVMLLQISAAMIRDPALAMEMVTGWRPHRRIKTPNAAYPSATEGQ